MTHPPSPVSSALRTSDVAELIVVSGYPCITLLLPTRVGPRLSPDDLRQLHRLIAEAESHLRDAGVPDAERLVDRLAAEARRACSQPTSRALAVYVSRTLARTFRLPQEVAARVVVEKTFATRPLVAALHRLPPHAVLVLHGTCAHLYSAVDGGLRPAGQVDPFASTGSVRLPRPGDPGARTAGAELTEAYLQAVDNLLGAYRDEHPSPLVLVGTPDLVERFAAVSRHLHRLAGRLDPADHLTALDLALASAEAVEGYLRTRRDDALEQLGDTLDGRPEAVAAGIDECWTAVRAGRPAMLLVEENFISPGEVPGGRTPPGPSPTSVPPGVHDRVDDLMEQVILRGGQLALVRDGDLADHGRIALVSRW